MAEFPTSCSSDSQSLELFTVPSFPSNDNLSLYSQQTSPISLFLDLKAQQQFQQFQMELQIIAQQMSEIRRKEQPCTLKNLKRVRMPRSKCCTICQERCPAGSKAVKLECQHTYHLPCISQWLVKHSTCPLCRREVP